jgi:hypothetical protein
MCHGSQYCTGHLLMILSVLWSRQQAQQACGSGQQLVHILHATRGPSTGQMRLHPCNQPNNSHLAMREGAHGQRGLDVLLDVVSQHREDFAHASIQLLFKEQGRILGSDLFEPPFTSSTADTATTLDRISGPPGPVTSVLMGSPVVSPWPIPRSCIFCSAFQVPCVSGAPDRYHVSDYELPVSCLPWTMSAILKMSCLFLVCTSFLPPGFCPCCACLACPL